MAYSCGSREVCISIRMVAPARRGRLQWAAAENVDDVTFPASRLPGTNHRSFANVQRSRRPLGTIAATFGAPRRHNASRDDGPFSETGRSQMEFASNARTTTSHGARTERQPRFRSMARRSARVESRRAASLRTLRRAATTPRGRFEWNRAAQADKVFCSGFDAP